MPTTDKPALCLRDELKAGERRALLTPDTAGALVEAGFPVNVEASQTRVFPLERYEAVGCKAVDGRHWQSAPNDTLILGLKELPVTAGPFVHRHVHFAHAFKYQSGWQAMLSAFTSGGGRLYDLEYLVDEDGRRVAAFGYWAGFVGAALGLMDGARLDTALAPWPDSASMIASAREAIGRRESPPRALVIGARGRSGRGAVDLLNACEVETTAWDIEETRGGGPFQAVLDHDLMINCVFVDRAVPPFTTHEHLNTPSRRLSMIVDVSCDPNGDYNPLPIYEAATTLDSPRRRLLNGDAHSPPLELIAIDHLPSLLPRESSEEFSNQLLPHLLQLDRLDQGVWARAAKVFDARVAEL